MKVLIKQAKIISPCSPFHGQTKSILVVNGKIEKIADDINEKADTIVAQTGLCVSVGWVDIFADFGDPGFEFNETIETGAKAAAAGGFTDIFIIPNTKPVTDTKSQVEYIIQKAKDTAINIHPLGAVTKNASGQTLSEMYDMRGSGAVAFSDGINSIQDPGLLLKALQYVKSFSGTVIQIPDDTSIGSNGLMNEGIVSTQLGLPGKPVMAEELMVARDIKLTRYAESKLHFTSVSSAKSLEYIKRAKESNAGITCSVTPYHLYFSEDDLRQYDTNLKVNPPLRKNDDVLALRNAVNDGLVDCIASHHLPQNWDHKTCEFEYAKNGMLGLETMFAVLNTVGCSPERFVEMQSLTARKIFGLPIPEIKEGADAILTLFDGESSSVYDQKNIRSRSANSPFIGKELKGKVIGIVNKGKIVLN